MRAHSGTGGRLFKTGVDIARASLPSAGIGGSWALKSGLDNALEVASEVSLLHNTSNILQNAWELLIVYLGVASDAFAGSLASGIPQIQQ